MKYLLLLVSLLTCISCTREVKPLGTAENPIKFYFVPSVDAQLIISETKKVKSYLENNTPFKFKIGVPSSYVAVVEAFGTERADVAIINTFGYLMANERYGAEAVITVTRHGSSTYNAQIIARKDSKITSLKDIDGKKVAFVDPSSTSGYLLPMKLFADNQIKPKEKVFAQKHDNVVTMVYQKQVDAGATFYSPPHNGKIEDARRLVKTQFPDIEDKVKIVELTGKIPNDPIIIRKGLKPEMKKLIQNALLEYIKTEEGKKVFYNLYGVSDFEATTDATYDGVRDMLSSLGKSATELVKK